MTDDDRSQRKATRRRTAIHEAGHAVATIVLGSSVEYASIRPGKTFSGIQVPVARELPDRSRWDPFAPVSTQPPEFRTDVERRIIATLAGPIAALYLAAPSSGRFDDGEDEEIARQALTSLAPRLADLVVMHELREEPIEGDEANAHALATASAGDRAGAFYLEWLRAEAQDLVIRYGAAILRVADALDRHAVLAGDTIAALVHPQDHQLAGNGRGVRTPPPRPSPAIAEPDGPKDAA